VAKQHGAIIHLQDSTDLIIPRAPFTRLVREIAEDFKTDTRFQATAIEAIQESAEGFVVEIFEKVKMIANHSNRVTVQPKDIHLLSDLGQVARPFNCHPERNKFLSKSERKLLNKGTFETVTSQKEREKEEELRKAQKKKKSAPKKKKVAPKKTAEKKKKSSSPKKRSSPSDSEDEEDFGEVEEEAPPKKKKVGGKVPARPTPLKQPAARVLGALKVPLPPQYPPASGAVQVSSPEFSSESENSNDAEEEVRFETQPAQVEEPRLVITTFNEDTSSAQVPQAVLEAVGLDFSPSLSQETSFLFPAPAAETQE